MLARDKNGKQVEVPTYVVDLMEKQGITDFAGRRKLVKAACSGLELVPPSVEEQVAGAGEWKKHAKKGEKEENLYLTVPGAILPSGEVCQGIFVRAELAPALFLEINRLLENTPTE